MPAECVGRVRLMGGPPAVRGPFFDNPVGRDRAEDVDEPLRGGDARVMSDGLAGLTARSWRRGGADSARGGSVTPVRAGVAEPAATSLIFLDPRNGVGGTGWRGDPSSAIIGVPFRRV